MIQRVKEKITKDLETLPAHRVLEWAIEKFSDKVTIASSFGAEDVVLIDMAYKINPEVKIFTLDTGRLPQQTYDVMDKIREKYGISIEVYFPETKAVEQMVRQHGANLFYKSIELRKLCCKVRKTDPLKRALCGLDAWVCGLRKEQAVTRKQIKKVEIDCTHGGIIKINPLTNWSQTQIWQYIEENDVPYNQLHNRGYPSIGCVPCTRPVKEGEDIRAGRWWWEEPDERECGLHCPMREKREEH